MFKKSLYSCIAIHKFMSYKYDFIENEDYLCFDMNVEGAIAKTYIVTLDMAKEQMSTFFQK